MSDIVQRLLKLADRERPYGSLPDTLEEAAAEIERLRAWNAEIALNAREFVAENEKLRAALEPLACTCDRANGAACSRAEANCAFWNARAALEGRT